MPHLNDLAWPMVRLGEAMAALAQHRGLAPRVRATPEPPEGLAQEGAEALGTWIETTAAWLGLEAEPVEVPYAEIKRLVRGAGPALLRLPSVGLPCFFVLLGGRRRVVSVLGPDLVVHRLPLSAVCTVLCREREAPLLADVERLLEEVNIPRRRRARARQAILDEWLRAERVGSCWLVRLPARASFWRQLRHTHVPQRLLVLVGAHAVQYGCWLLAWWVVGQGALQGRLDRSWLMAWALLGLTLVPLRLLVTWMQGWCAIGVGGLLKRRLLTGALRLAPEEILQQGAGRLLGRVIESEAVEALALSGGVLGLMAGLELVMAAAVLGLGASGGLLALLLLGWVALSSHCGWRYVQQRQHWTAARLDLTHDVVERMVGYRTRLAQEAPAYWHTGEDEALARYLERSRGMDRAATWLLALVPRGWLLLGLGGLTPAFLTSHSAPAALAVSLGGILLAYEACKKLAIGLWHLTGAAIAWQQAAPLFHAATRSEGATLPACSSAPGKGDG
jgi:ATP-binding cassette subfamily B protein